MDKICIKCGEPKDAQTDFYHPLFHQDNICKACRNEYDRRKYAAKRANREMIRLARIEKYISEIHQELGEVFDGKK
jgi:hypothetical protein